MTQTSIPTSEDFDILPRPLKSVPMNIYSGTHPMPDFIPDCFSAHLTDDPAKEPIAVGDSIPDLSQMREQRPVEIAKNFRLSGSLPSGTSA